MINKEYYDKFQKDLDQILANFIKKNKRRPTKEEAEELENEYYMEHFDDVLNSISLQDMLDTCNSIVDDLEERN